MEAAVFPDAVRGVYALLDEVGELANHAVRPELIVPVDYSDQGLPVVVHVQRGNTAEGAVDRVEEIRLIVYGFTPLQSQDIGEAIISVVTGDGVETPPSPDSSGFYFDSIRQRVGPSSVEWPTDQVFPVSISVDVRARPMSF